MGLKKLLRRTNDVPAERDRVAQRVLVELVRGEEPRRRLELLGVRFVSEGDTWWVEVPDGLRVAEPELRDLAHGLLHHAPFATGLRDWARLVICLTSFEPVEEEPGCDRLVDAVSAAAEGKGVDDETLELAHRIVHAGPPAALSSRSQRYERDWPALKRAPSSRAARTNPALP
jgi:hypothetical protein